MHLCKELQEASLSCVVLKQDIRGLQTIMSRCIWNSDCFNVSLPEIERIQLSMPNLHFIPVNMPTVGVKVPAFLDNFAWAILVYE